MKNNVTILFIAKYIYHENDKTFKKNKTGYGYMVKDIAESVIDYGHEVYLYTNAITDRREIDGIHVCKHTWIDIFKNANLKNWKEFIKSIFITKGSINKRFKCAYFELDIGCLKKTIEEVKPDIIHVHGISYRTENFLSVFKEVKIPFCFTLHALIGLSDTVEGDKEEAKYEQVFLQRCANEKIPVVLISTGMLHRIRDIYKIESDTFRVICNGTNLKYDFSSHNQVNNVIDKYGVSKDKKILLIIGNVCKRKNQIIVPEIVSLLSKEDKDQIEILIAGRDFLEGKLQNKINEYSLNETIKFIGFVEKAELELLYDVAFGIMIVSVDEAFGLPIIEGFARGLPTIMYRDLDAALDVYDKESVILVNERDHREYAKSLAVFLNKEWDKDSIKRSGDKFSLGKMAQKYIKLYQSLNFIDE